MKAPSMKADSMDDATMSKGHAWKAFRMGIVASGIIASGFKDERDAQAFWLQMRKRFHDWFRSYEHGHRLDLVRNLTWHRDRIDRRIRELENGTSVVASYVGDESETNGDLRKSDPNIVPQPDPTSENPSAIAETRTRTDKPTGT